MSNFFCAMCEDILDNPHSDYCDMCVPDDRYCDICGCELFGDDECPACATEFEDNDDDDLIDQDDEEFLRGPF